MPFISKLYRNRIIRCGIIAFLSALALLSVFQGFTNALEASQDFQWDASKALCMRLDPYELSNDPQKALEYPPLAEFYRMYTDKGLKQKMEANQFPSLLLLLAPMTVFAPESARVVWAVLNLLFTAGIIILLKKTFFGSTGAFEYGIIVLLMLAGTPYRNQLGVGQHTLFAFFFFMLAVYLDQNPPSRYRTVNLLAVSGCLFVSYFKYTLTAPLALLFLYRRKYKELALSVAAHIILTAGCALWLGKSFVYMIKAPLQVASVLVSEGGIDLGVIFGARTGYIIAFVIAVILTYTAIRFAKGRDNELLAMLILWSLVITYHRTYDFFVLSAVAMLFTFGFEEHFSETGERFVQVMYWVLILMMYFVLRIFDENTSSKTVAGVLYYAFTIIVTITLIRYMRMDQNER